MKIEMGESLFYSWLRHVKECQIVQTNWKVSPQWDLQHEEELEVLQNEVAEHFKTKCNYDVFKQNRSLSQIIQQGECDVLGISVDRDKSSLYAVDVAFHEDGLNYGPKDVTVAKVIAKLTRTAVCLYGYFDAKEAELIFGSPKINPAILNELTPCIDDLNHIFQSQGYGFKARVIANDSFDEKVFQPILLVSEGIADTSELFIRSYQMYRMFLKKDSSGTNSAKTESVSLSQESCNELKIGKLVQSVLKPLLVSSTSEEEIRQMQEAEYSKTTFGITYPLLVKTSQPFDKRRYYSDAIEIRGEKYHLCSQWFETPANNDRPYVEKWIREHCDLS